MIELLDKFIILEGGRNLNRGANPGKNAASLWREAHIWFAR
jgi:hypothetical protein